MSDMIVHIATLMLVLQGEGASLFAMRCASCHGVAAQGSNVAPSLISLPASDIHLMLDTGRMPAAEPSANDAHLRPIFTQPQMQAIVSYVMALSRNADRSLPDVSGGNPLRGRRLFVENCEHCHGAVADGASVGYTDVAPSLVHATEFQVAEAIRAGPGVMPRFSRSRLSDRDVDDIARYVNVLQTQAGLRVPLDAGGDAMAHTGAVAEGVLAWLAVGLLALFMFVMSRA